MRPILLILALSISAQAICQTKFIRTYSGLPAFYSLKKSTDKGYIMTGIVYDTSVNAGIYKTDSLGHMLWERSLGQSNYEEFRYGEETHDGGYIATGYNRVPGPSSNNIMLSKFTSSGVLSWNRSLGLSTTGSYGLRVHEEQDHGFTVAGYNNLPSPSYLSRCYLLKTDSLGQVIWSRLWGLPFQAAFTGACRTTDGGYVFLAANQAQSPGYNIILLRADKAGNFLWAKTIGGASDEYGNGIAPTSNNGVMLAGGTNGYNCDSSDILIVSIDSTGNIAWAKTYGAPGQDEAFSVLQTNDGGFILSGRIGQGAINYNKGLALKTDANGTIHWAKTYMAANHYPTYTIEQADDGGYAIAGAVSDSLSSASLIKTDTAGNSCDDSFITLWSQSISIPSAPLAITVDSGGTSIPVSLLLKPFSGEHLLCIQSMYVPGLSAPKVSVYPNPSPDGKFVIELPAPARTGTIDLFNSYGQKIRSLPLSKVIDLTDLPRGLYHYSISFGQSPQRFGGTIVYR